MRERAEVLREYQDFYAELLRYNSHLRESIEKRDAPERRHRWRVVLDCGCATEALTYGEDHPPTDGPWIKALGNEQSGPAGDRTFVIDAGSHVLGTEPGYLWCSGYGTAHGDQEHPWREIAKWVERRREGWTNGRHWAAWTVLLSCGHVDYYVFTDPDWRPEHGHRPDPEMAEKARRGLARPDLDDRSRRYFEPRLAGEWPEPETGDECAACVCSRRIISFEPLGPLTWPGDSERPSREALTRRLSAAETEADELRERLAKAEAAAAELRVERDRSFPK